MTNLNSSVKVSDSGAYKWRLVIAYDGTRFAGSSSHKTCVLKFLMHLSKSCFLISAHLVSQVGSIRSHHQLSNQC